MDLYQKLFWMRMVLGYKLDQMSDKLIEPFCFNFNAWIQHVVKCDYDWVKIINEEMNKVFTNAATKWVGQKRERERESVCESECVWERERESGKSEEKIIAIWYLGQYILLDLEVKRCAWVLSLSLSLCLCVCEREGEVNGHLSISVGH